MIDHPAAPATPRASTGCWRRARTDDRGVRPPRRADRRRTCGSAATRRCASSRERFDRLRSAARGVSRRDAQPAPTRAGRRPARAIQQAARNIARSRAPDPEPLRPARSRRASRSSSASSRSTRVGCYVPGGRFPLPSSLLMTAVPARVAGVREIIAVCPRPEPVVMAAALEAGVTRLFRIGGAHAVAALAYGTAHVPRVDKIVGPGQPLRRRGQGARRGRLRDRLLRGADRNRHRRRRGRPDWIAADLIAQAEHDPDARAIFITWSRSSRERVGDAVDGAAAGRTIVQARRSPPTARIIVARVGGRGDGARQPLRAGAPGRRSRSS